MANAPIIPMNEENFEGVGGVKNFCPFVAPEWNASRNHGSHPWLQRSRRLYGMAG